MIPVFKIESLEVIGQLVIDFSTAEIQAALDTVNKNNSEFFILAPDDTIVYHSTTDLLGIPRSQTGLSKLKLDGQHTTTIQTWRDKKMLVSVSPSEMIGWNFVTLVTYASMAGGLNAARNATLFSFAIISVSILILVPILSGRLVRPIVILKKLMSHVANGDTSVRAEINGSRDEFQDLSLSFNRMVGKLKELMETVFHLRLKEMQFALKQKEAVVRALQNQINPHLLYNSLDLIKSIAYMEGNERIEKLSRNLAGIYRYNAKFSDEEVTLQDELNHLTKYLEIVKIRFPIQFQSKIYVNEWFVHCSCVKLILQPIAENAVKFAVEPKGGDSVIIISAYEQSGDLIIEIADNGPGIPAWRLQQLHEQLAAISENCMMETIQNESLGIANVHARLVLKYGESYGLRLNSFEARGTVVSIRIPLREKAPEQSALVKASF